MQTKREYLASLTPPLAIAGARGRFSREGNEAIAKAEKAGMVFADSASEKAKAIDSKKKDSAPKPERDSAKEFFGDTPAQLYDGGWYIVEGDKNIPLSGKEVCRTKGCMVSLDWHRCATPVFPDGKGEMVTVYRKIG